MENPYDIDLYIERKTPFIIAILKEVGFDDKSLENITSENKIPKSSQQKHGRGPEEE
jgi:hypothetical protein